MCLYFEWIKDKFNNLLNLQIWKKKISLGLTMWLIVYKLQAYFSYFHA